MNDVNSLIRDSHMPTSLCNWLQCLRTPGITLKYTLQKQHIPDMSAAEAAPASPSSTTAAPLTDTAESSSPADSTDTTDIMQVSGTLRARYFDLAAGALAILAGCMLIKGCLCGCRCLKRMC